MAMTNLRAKLSNNTPTTYFSLKSNNCYFSMRIRTRKMLQQVEKTRDIYWSSFQQHFLLPNGNTNIYKS